MWPLPLNRLLMLQTAYAYVGVMYNVGSLLALRNDQAAWASTDAVTGVAGMSLYWLFVSAGLMKNPALYRLLMGASVALLGYGGVITHLLNFGQMDLYQSTWTWAAAIGINGFGLLLNLAAAGGWFTRPASSNGGAVR